MGFVGFKGFTASGITYGLEYVIFFMRAVPLSYLPVIFGSSYRCSLGPRP